METTFVLSAIIGSLISGAVVGAIPAICGAKKQKLKLGILGFFTCVICSFLLGLLLSVPACAVFLYLIFKPEKKGPDDTNTPNPF